MRRDERAGRGRRQTAASLSRAVEWTAVSTVQAGETGRDKRPQLVQSKHSQVSTRTRRTAHWGMHGLFGPGRALTHWSRTLRRFSPSSIRQAVFECLSRTHALTVSRSAAMDPAAQTNALARPCLRNCACSTVSAVESIFSLVQLASSCPPCFVQLASTALPVESGVWHGAVLSNCPSLLNLQCCPPLGPGVKTTDPP